MDTKATHSKNDICVSNFAKLIRLRLTLQLVTLHSFHGVNSSHKSNAVIPCHRSVWELKETHLYYIILLEVIGLRITARLQYIIVVEINCVILEELRVFKLLRRAIHKPPSCLLQIKNVHCQVNMFLKLQHNLRMQFCPSGLEKGIITERVFTESLESLKWSDSPLFSRVLGFSRNHRISKFSRISRQFGCTPKGSYSNTAF